MFKSKFNKLIKICCGTSLAGAGVGVGIVFDSLVLDLKRLVYKKSNLCTSALFGILDTEIAHIIFAFVFGIIVCLLLLYVINKLKAKFLKNNLQVVIENKQEDYFELPRYYALNYVELNLLINWDNPYIDYNKKLTEVIIPYANDSNFLNIKILLCKTEFVFDDESNKIFQEERFLLTRALNRFFETHKINYQTGVFLRIKNNSFGFDFIDKPDQVKFIGFSEIEIKAINHLSTWWPTEEDILWEVYMNSDKPKEILLMSYRYKWYET